MTLEPSMREKKSLANSEAGGQNPLRRNLNFIQHRPAPPLDRFVDWFWYFDSYMPEHRTERVLPEGSFELVINLRDEPHHTFDPISLKPRRDYRNAWISGTQSGYLVIDTAPYSSMIGVHFKPGGAAPFLGIPASELADRVEELDCIWGREALSLREALLDARDPSLKFRVLADFLGRRLNPASVPNLAVQEALARFMAEPQMIALEEVIRSLGISHKHFIKLFREEVGLTPKRFCRVRRFQQVLHDLQTRKEIRWVDVACSGGFYDQAHLINEFEAFCGISPVRYMNERADSLNFVPMK